MVQNAPYLALTLPCEPSYAALTLNAETGAGSSKATMMIVVVVMYTFPADRADEAERLLRELRDASRSEAGCRGYEVVRGDGDASATFALHETYADQAAYDAHQASDHFRRLGLEGIRTFMTERRAVKGTPVE